MAKSFSISLQVGFGEQNGHKLLQYRIFQKTPFIAAGTGSSCGILLRGMDYSKHARATTLFLLVAVAALTIGVTLGYILSSYERVQAPRFSAHAPTSEEAAILKAQLDYYQKEADDLQRLTSALLLLTTLFTAAAGITTYINVNQSIEKAEKLVEGSEGELAVSKTRVDEALKRVDAGVAELKHRAESEMADIRREFPMFGYMNQVIKNILNELTRLLDPDFLTSAVGERTEVFKKLSTDKRQRIMFYEKTVASLALLDLREHNRELAAIYRGLGIFFGSKAYSKQTGVHQEELDKALFYLDRSQQIDSECAATLNEMAYFMLDEENPSSFFRAEQLLSRSLDILDNQQRARMNLAYIYCFQKRYTEAASVLKEALTRTSWETGNDAPHPRDIHFNYAYALAGLSRLDAAIEHLEIVFEIPDEYRCEWVRKALTDPNDEFHKLNDQPYRDRILAILSKASTMSSTTQTGIEFGSDGMSSHSQEPTARAT